jgi:UDP-glucose 4-epimerase
MRVDGAKCLVLGGGGFIGTNLCVGLTKAGAAVEVFGRRPFYQLPFTNTRWHEAEFSDASQLTEAVAGKDFVFHLLGGSVPAQSNSDPAGDVESSLLPSLQLMNICRAAQVKRIIFSSSGGTVYGVTDAQPILETSPTEPITAYGVNKLAVEKYLSLYRRLYGLDSVVLRISNPYGPYQYGRRPQGVVGTLLAKALTGEMIEIWGDGSVVRDFLHVDDAVAAMIAAASYEGGERLFNVGSGQGRSMRDVVESIRRELTLDAERICYRPGRETDVPVNILNINLIKRTIGWTPKIDWATGLAATVKWMKEEQWHEGTGKK